MGSGLQIWVLQRLVASFSSGIGGIIQGGETMRKPKRLKRPPSDRRVALAERQRVYGALMVARSSGNYEYMLENVNLLGQMRMSDVQRQFLDRIKEGIEANIAGKKTPIDWASFTSVWVSETGAMILP